MRSAPASIAGIHERNAWRRNGGGITGRPRAKEKEVFGALRIDRARRGKGHRSGHLSIFRLAENERVPGRGLPYIDNVAGEIVGNHDWSASYSCILKNVAKYPKSRMAGPQHMTGVRNEQFNDKVAVPRRLHRTDEKDGRDSDLLDVPLDVGLDVDRGTPRA
jgi:hypothetical protein